MICPICNSNRTGRHKRVNEFEVFKCRECELIWVPGVTGEQLANFYNSNYFSSNTDFGYRDYLGDEKIHRSNARKILQSLPVSSTNKYLLDVGCGHGFLLDEARKQGWKTQGVELALAACRYAREKFGLEIFNGTLEEARFEDESYDTITITGTIEHLPNPVATIREMSRILKKRGLLATTTINTKGPIRLYRLIPPEHLYYYSMKNLTRLLAQEKFEPVKCYRCHWAYYRLDEAIFRLWRLIIPWFSIGTTNRSFGRLLPLLRLIPKIPTNEMLLIVRKT